MLVEPLGKLTSAEARRDAVAAGGFAEYSGWSGTEDSGDTAE